MRTFFLLAASLSVGYWYGFRDAQTHDEPLQRRVAEQMVQKAGGSSRTRVNADIDAKMARLER
ncbi:MAG: hypothetical protein AVDCRST_MAG11-3702 [uncultured Gemmatimonadaceae bacterium]|uniref:Uncharacterized protein n=1 Tax=uncultured Gemmatimonadaceae bacterium TaxID=246130 RepID=A0A6J4MAL9_9BACT|nr:MAG: hypothetical protein AVDCRST_MAG11-3702 [uncultured Gemmatimonadaceae bacterium]